MGFQRFAFLAILLICSVPRHSTASFFETLRTAQVDDKSKTTHVQISPSPSPVPPPIINSKENQSSTSPPEEKTCDTVSYKCDILRYSISGCAPFLGNASEEEYVLVINRDKSTHTINITFVPQNYTMKNISIPGHQSKKVKLPLNSGSKYTSIFLSSENGNCTIYRGASVLDTLYSNYITPINGTYLIFVTVLFSGGILICYKFSKTGRHLTGVKYRELEMGNREPDSTFVIDSPNDWNQEWNDEDDWDIERH